MNHIALLGRLTRDPETRYTNSGRCVVQFTVAVDRPFKNENGEVEADFIPCVLWGKTAEQLGNTVAKGQRVLVQGRLQIRSYEAKDGSRKYVTEVICSNFEYIERKSDVSAQSQRSAAPAQKTQQGDFEGMGTAVPFDAEIPF